MQITQTEAQSCGHCPWELGVQGDPEARASLGPDEPCGLVVTLHKELARSCSPPVGFLSEATARGGPHIITLRGFRIQGNLAAGGWVIRDPFPLTCVLNGH